LTYERKRMHYHKVGLCNLYSFTKYYKGYKIKEDEYATRMKTIRKTCKILVLKLKKETTARDMDIIGRTQGYKRVKMFVF
jgi:hypothetical protein